MNLLRAGVCVLLAFTVLALGGVEVWSQSLLEMGSAVLLVVWAFLLYRNSDLKIQWSPLYWPLLGYLGIGFLQLLFHGTANPFLTRVELLRLTSFFLVFFLTAQAFLTRADLSKLAWFLILLCFSVSLLGIIQHFTSKDEIYWLSQLKIVVGDPFGPYVNRNHFAGFVELTLPIGLALLFFRGLNKDLLPLTTLLTIVPISAVVLSSSRGGIVCLAFELAVLVVLERSRSRLIGKAPPMIAVGLAVLATLALIAWVGAGRAIERFSTMDSHNISLDRRISMFRGAVHVFLDHPIKGCGLGTLVDVYPLYETAYDGKLIDHVHNDYMETLAETGLLGGLCGLMFLWILFREARRNFIAGQGHFSRALHAGAIVALSGLLLHSFVDFNLHIPSNALLFLLQAFLATSAPLSSKSSPSIGQKAPPLRESPG